MSLSILRLALWACCCFGTSAACLASELQPLALRPPAVALRIIELPPTFGGPEAARLQRSHHALSFDTDAPKPWLRSLGLTPTDCSLRLRLPSRLRTSKGSPNGSSLDVQAQAGMGCRF